MNLLLRSRSKCRFAEQYLRNMECVKCWGVIKRNQENIFGMPPYNKHVYLCITIQITIQYHFIKSFHVLTQQFWDIFFYVVKWPVFWWVWVKFFHTVMNLAFYRGALSCRNKKGPCPNFLYKIRRTQLSMSLYAVALRFARSQKLLQ